MANQLENSKSLMEWATAPFNWSEFYFRSIIYHSTPKQFRPLPPASPNFSMIYEPNSVMHCSESDPDPISQLVERFAKMKLK